MTMRRADVNPAAGRPTAARSAVSGGRLAGLAPASPVDRRPQKAGELIYVQAGS
jgi:hypothetical protein